MAIFFLNVHRDAKKRKANQCRLIKLVARTRRLTDFRLVKLNIHRMRYTFRQIKICAQQQNLT